MAFAVLDFIDVDNGKRFALIGSFKNFLLSARNIPAERMPFPATFHDNNQVIRQTNFTMVSRNAALNIVREPFACLNSCSLPNPWMISSCMPETNVNAIYLHRNTDSDGELCERKMLPIRALTPSNVSVSSHERRDFSDLPHPSMEMERISTVANEIETAEEFQSRTVFESAIIHYKLALNGGSISNDTRAKILYNMSLCHLGLGEEEKAAEIRDRITLHPPRSSLKSNSSIPLHIHSAPMDLVRLVKKLQTSGDIARSIKYLDMVSVSRAFRFDASLLMWLSRLDDSRSQSLESYAKSLLPSIT